MRDLGDDGFDRNTVAHFRVATNLLRPLSILICPADSERKAAASAAVLASTNTTYKLRPTANPDQMSPEMMVFCPVHGQGVRANGSTKRPEPQ